MVFYISEHFINFDKQVSAVLNNCVTAVKDAETAVVRARIKDSI